MPRSAITFILFFLLAAAVYGAAPVLQTSADNTGQLTILYPDRPYVALTAEGVHTDFNFLVVNSSGKALNFSAQVVNCSYGIENSTGNVIQQGYLHSHDTFWMSFQPYTHKLGKYNYAIWCNSSEREHGYLISSYQVKTYNDPIPEDGKYLIAIIALIPLVIGLFLILGAISLGESHAILKWFLLLLSPALGITSLHYATLGVVRFYTMPELQDAVGSTVYWFGIIWGVLITYIIIYGMIVMIHTAAQKKKERLEY